MQPELCELRIRALCSVFIFSLVFVQFRLDKFLIRKKEVKKEPDATEMASASVAGYTKPDEPPWGGGSKLNQGKYDEAYMGWGFSCTGVYLILCVSYVA